MLKTIFLRFMVYATGIEATLAESFGNRSRIRHARAEYRAWYDQLDSHLISKFLERIK